MKTELLNIEFKLINPALADYGLPQYESTEAAAMDIRAMIEEDEITVAAGDSFKFGAGFGFHINNPFIAAYVLPRSGVGVKGLVLKNTIGLIDPDYQGEIVCNVRNANQPGSEPIKIERGQRLFQLVFAPIIRVNADWIDEFSGESNRGIGGFGSTGKA